ncbi:hypothetical protein Sps_05026 [Shewanella psychrophila]|uniref:Uncharacterized protein n=1 Tax=Shewanella psychrophila TaxID=225848 RepID=A0A1S6HXE5_9GAMM|nr:hypothetical protein [Shewanella psychrophila]AQS40104.1 hypothetical protein Sps_05026 [Shewanella psychrophila]
MHAVSQALVAEETNRAVNVKGFTKIELDQKKEELLRKVGIIENFLDATKKAGKHLLNRPSHI